MTLVYCDRSGFDVNWGDICDRLSRWVSSPLQSRDSISQDLNLHLHFLSYVRLDIWIWLKADQTPEARYRNILSEHSRDSLYVISRLINHKRT